MKQVSCQQVRDWAHQVVHDQRFKLFDTDQIFQHVAGCDECRGVLITCSLLEPTLFPIYKPISCADCQSKLAAFVDAAELAPGSEIAIYPEVWWHLLSCQDCADEYVALRAFAMSDAAAVAAEVVDSQAAARVARRVAQLTLKREFLRTALPPFLTARPTVYRGGHVEEHLLTRENVAPGFQAIVGVRQESAEYWSVIISIVPPVAGVVVLKLGDLVQQATLDALGNATVSAVPAAILLTADGPDIEIGIHSDLLLT